MKKLITILLTTGLLSSCGTPAVANAPTAVILKPVATTQKWINVSAQTVDAMALIDHGIRQTRLDKVISQVKARVGKTWYVFSGATPRGWDCSGLTMWAYEQLGIEIPHSATKQAKVGTIVTDPKPGDIVLFGYKGYKSYYHAALYIGGGKVVHAGFRKGTTTAIIPLSSPAFKGSRITFIRVLDTTPITG